MLRALQEFTQTIPAWLFGYVTSYWKTICGNHSGTRGLWDQTFATFAPIPAIEPQPGIQAGKASVRT